MRNETDSACFGDSVYECLWVICQAGEVSIGIEHQQVVLLRDPVLVVDFLSNQEQDAVSPKRRRRADAVVSFHALDKGIVIRDDNGIQSRFDGGIGNVLVSSGSIRVAGVHVQVYDDFVHETSS
jgi:hypothetical protein